MSDAPASEAPIMGSPEGAPVPTERDELVGENAFAFGVMAVTLLGLALRGMHLDIPMRYDEAVTFTEYASKGWRTVTTAYANPNNHVFHSLLVGWMTGWLGPLPAVIRIPAFFAGVAVIPVTAWVGLQARGRATALIAAAVVATSPVLIEYSTNARGYTLLALMTLLGVGVGQRLLERPSPILWFALADVAVIGFFTIPTMALPWLGLTLWLGFNLAIRAEDPADRLRALGWLVGTNLFAGLVTVALYWGIIASEGFGALAGNRFVAPMALGDFLAGFPAAAWAAVTHWTRGLPFPLALVGAAAAVVGFGGRDRRNPMPLVFSLLAGSVAVIFVMRNHGEPRIWLWVVPLLAVAIGIGVETVLARVPSVPYGRTALLCAGGWAALASIPLVVASPVRASLETGGFPEVEEIALGILEHYRPGDMVVSDFVSQEPLSFYVTQYGLPEELVGEPGPGVQRTWVVVNRREDIRTERVTEYLETIGAPALEASTPIFSVGEADVYLFGRPADRADRRLLEAIDWYTGVAGRVDDERARALLEEVLDDTGSPLARMWLARAHSRGRMGFEQNEELARLVASEALQELRELAEVGEAEAIFLLGTAYDEGLGVEVDPAQAFEWHLAAAEVGHVLGAHNVGNQYAAGRGVAADPEAAVFWWTQAAAKGDAVTQLRLGEAYEAGNGVERDLTRALTWYRRAAERGNEAAAEAVRRLGG